MKANIFNHLQRQLIMHKERTLRLKIKHVLSTSAHPPPPPGVCAMNFNGLKT